MRVMTGVVAVSISMLTGLGAGSASSQQKPAAAQPQTPPRTDSQTATAAGTAPIYKPPPRGAPGGRVGGGTRGTGRETFVLSVLAPADTGLTTSQQPTLYWFISTSTSSPVELTVTDPRATQPLLETRIPGPVVPGVHRIRLADHGIRLAPGVPYRWFVAVVPDAGRRSRDVLAGGTIEFTEPPADVKTTLSGAQKAERPAIYAASGFWYDAVAAISELIEASPENATLKTHRASLMAQVGLPGIE